MFDGLLRRQSVRLKHRGYRPVPQLNERHRIARLWIEEVRVNYIASRQMGPGLPPLLCRFHRITRRDYECAICIHKGNVTDIDGLAPNLVGLDLNLKG